MHNKPEHKKYEYKNGLRLLAVPMQNTHTVTVLVLVRTGSRYETREINGISHFLEHLMFKGTKKRPGALDISEELDAIGAEYNAFTSKEYTGYYVKCAADKMHVALDVISDIFQNSKFDAAEMDKERGPIKEEINMYFDNPGRYNAILYELLVYGDNSLGWDIAGPKENIDKLQRENIVNYFDTHYFAGNTVIAIAGNFDGEKIYDEVEKYFNNTRQHKYSEPEKVEDKQLKPALNVFLKETEQTSLQVGFRAYGRFDPRYEILQVLATILGGGMSSRMFVEVREKRGLAYRVGCDLTAYNETGDFSVAAGLNNEKLFDALDVIFGEFKKIAEHKVPEKELIKAKDYIRGKFLIGLESSDAQAGFYGEQELLENRILTPEEKLAIIEAVTVDQCQSVASELMIHQKLNLALVGPLKGKENKLREILENFGLSPSRPPPYSKGEV